MANVEQPKKAKSSYFLWLDENRAAITKELGTAKGSEVTKAAGEKWKTLSADDKKPYEERAAKLKDEYEAAVQAFKDGGGEIIRRSKKDKKEKRGKKAKKDPDAPKRPAGGGYGVYVAEHREEITKGLPADHKMTDVTKAASDKWKAMSESEKKVYVDKYLAKKAEYDTALAAYKAAGGGAGDDEADKVASPPAKGARKRVADDSSKKEPKAKQLKRGRASKGAASPKDAVKIEDDVLEAAQKLNYDSALKNLAARPEIAELNLPGKKMLEALKKSEGLVNSAKRFLLGA